MSTATIMQRLFGRPRAGGEGQETHWLSVADLMAGLMMVFLFIAVALMREVYQEREQIREIAVSYQENQVAIYQALKDEFEADLERWLANIDRETLSFQFQSPEVLFEIGSSEIRSRFQEILDDFFPRYLKVLEEFTDSIDEVRVEGHTSSEWGDGASDTEAYFRNMNLSQGRTRSVLEYVYRMPDSQPRQSWVKRHFAAVGFSSSRLVLGPDGEEDPAASRRVAFRVVTNAEIQMQRILERAGGESP